MNNIFKNIRKQVHAKKHTVGSLIISMLIIAVSLSVFLVIVPDRTESAYTDFTYNKQITLNYSQVPSSLTGFPVLINIESDSDLADNCVNDSGYDIAFYNATNATQFPHEIEYWNDDGNYVNASIWVNVSALSSSENTTMYMYYGYDNTNQQNKAGTWDSNYIGVWHMNSSTSIVYDSTEANDGSKKGAAEPVQASGMIAYGQGFDGADDYVDMGYDSSLELSTLTIEAWFETDGYNNSDHQEIATKDDDWYFFIDYQEDNKITFNPHGATPKVADAAPPSNNTWYYAVGRYNGTHGNLYINGSLVDSDVNSAPPSGGHDFVVGAHGDGSNGGTPDSGWFNGTIDEVRYSDIARSDDWITTSYNTMNNATDGGFYSFGTEEGEVVSSFNLYGLTSGRITWAGLADTTVWCNSSGDGNEWLEINMTINASSNVTEIQVWVGDLNTSGATAWINATNITMYVSNSSNSTYYSFGSFDDAGSNITINQTTWNTNIVIDNPFNGTGLTDTNTSIFLIFSLAIPSGLSADTFTSVTTTAWKVYIGYV